MAAIITDEFRKAAAQKLMDDINSAGTYYIGVGKSDGWGGVGPSTSEGSVPTPESTPGEVADVYSNLISVKKVETDSAYRLIPRVDWVTGRKYKRYNPEDPDCFFATAGSPTLYPCYVINSNRDLFICLRHNAEDDSQNSQGTTSTTEPSLTGTANAKFGSTGSYGIHVAADGYVWAYVCTVKKTTGFWTNQFFAISDPGGTHVTNEVHSGSDSPAVVTGGMLFGFDVDSQGSGYSEGDITLVLRGDTATDDDDSQAALVIELTDDSQDGGIYTDIYGGKIERIHLEDDRFTFANRIKGLKNLSVEVDASAGSGAKVRALLAPYEGFGSKILKLLPSYYLGVRADFENLLGTGADADGFYIPFRQVSLLGNVEGVDDSAECLYKMTGTLDAGVSATNPDTYTGYWMWQGTESTAQAAMAAHKPVAFIDTVVDDSPDVVYYHYNRETSGGNPVTNFLPFQPSTTLKFASTFTGTGATFMTSPTAPIVPEFDVILAYDSAGTNGQRQNGDVLFVENRTKVSRAEDQTEEIRLIIQM